MSPRRALLLALLLLALAGVVVGWLRIDRRPPEWDHANHLERALTCHRILAEPGHDRLRELIALSSFYPPVVTCAAGLLYFALPVSPLTAQAVMWGFLVVGVLAVYGTARHLLGSEAGLPAAFLFATAPFVVFSLLSFQLDLPLAAMAALALYALARAKSFAEPRWSWSVGLVLGLGMLTKPPFAVYVLPPLAWSAWLALRAPDRGARLRRLAGALLLGALIALPWYGPRLAGLPMQIVSRSFKQAAESGHAPPFSVEGLLFYPRMAVPQLGLLATALLLWGVVAVRRFPRARALAWSALAPLAGFLLIQNKNLRYTLPLLPAAALVASAGLAALRAPWRRAVTWACVALGLVQVGAAAFGVPSPSALAPVVPALAVSRPPDGGDWRHRDVLEAIQRESRGREVTVAVVPNDNFFSVSNFRYEALRDRLPFRMTRPWGQSPFGVDFVIAKTGDQGPDAASDKSDRIMAAFEGGDPWLAAAYPVIARFPLPDGSTGMVRARRIEPLRGIRAVEFARRLPGAVERALAEHVREAEGLRVTPRYRLDRLMAGEVDELVVEAHSALVGEFARRRPPLRVREVRVRVEGVLLHPQRLADTGRLEVLDARSVSVERLAVDEVELARFLAAQKGLRRLQLVLEEGAARVRMSLPGPDLAARVRLGPGLDASPFSLAADEVYYGRVPLPRLLVDWVVRNFDPTPRLRRLPVTVTLAPIRIVPGRIEIGGAEAGG